MSNTERKQQILSKKLELSRFFQRAKNQTREEKAAIKLFHEISDLYEQIIASLEQEVSLALMGHTPKEDA